MEKSSVTVETTVPYLVFKNQSIYIRCHKSFGFNLGGLHWHTVFYADYIILFSFVGGKYEPSGWLSTEAIAFKILQPCLYKISLIETGEETKRYLWRRSIKSCIIFKSDSDASYTERQYVKFGRTKDLNKWSISTWENYSLLRDLKTCKHLFAWTWT